MTRWSCRLAAIAGMLAASTAVQAQCNFTLSGANVWTGQEFAQQDLSVAGDRFVAEAPPDGAVVPASWLYIVPPLADLHTHNLDQPTGPDDESHARHLGRGIFYALNPNNIRSDDTAHPFGSDQVEASYAGGGLTGAGGHPRPLYEALARSGQLGDMAAGDLPGRAFHEVTTAEEARAAVERVREQGANVVKLYLLYHEEPDSLSLTPELFRAAAEHAESLDMLAVAHVNSVADFRLAAETGVAAAVHMPGAMPRRDDDAVYMLTPEDAALARAGDMTVVPTISIAFNALTGDALARAQGIQRHNLTLLRDAGVRIAAGADRYQVPSTDELNLLRATTLFDGSHLLRIATTNGIETLFPDRRVGRLEPGYEASFLMYFADPRTNWLGLGNPIGGMRAGETIIENTLIPNACGETETE